MANIEKIVLPDNTQYNIKDANALPLSAGSSYPLTNPLTIQSVTLDGGDGNLNINGDIRRVPKNYSQKISVTISNPDNTKVAEITNIEPGVYLINGYVHLTLEQVVNTNVYLNCYKSSIKSSPIFYSLHTILGREDGYFQDTSWATFTSEQSTVSLWVQPGNKCAVTCNLYLLRIA